MPFVSAQELQALRGEVAAQRNSKYALPSRLTDSPESFGFLGEVSEVERGQFVTTFTLGGDVATVAIDGYRDVATISPIRHAAAFKPVVINLKNSTPEVDFDEEDVKELYQAYTAFERGPAPTVADLMAGLNRHVANG